MTFPSKSLIVNLIYFALLPMASSAPAASRDELTLAVAGSNWSNQGPEVNFFLGNKSASKLRLVITAVPIFHDESCLKAATAFDARNESSSGVRDYEAFFATIPPRSNYNFYSSMKMGVPNPSVNCGVTFRIRDVKGKIYFSGDFSPGFEDLSKLKVSAPPDAFWYSVEESADNPRLTVSWGGGKESNAPTLISLKDCDAAISFDETSKVGVDIPRRPMLKWPQFDFVILNVARKPMPPNCRLLIGIPDEGFSTLFL